MRRLTIGELAKRAGVGVETVRFYQRRGLLPVPPRRGREYRVYPTSALNTLRFIRRARGLGFTLREIGDLLTLERSGDATIASIRPVLLRKVRELEEKSHEIAVARRALEGLVAAWDEAPPPAGEAVLPLIFGSVQEPPVDASDESPA